MKTKNWKKTLSESVARKSRESSGITAKPPNTLWAVMKAQTWDSVEIGGIELRTPIGGPQRFIPVFNTRKQAEKWTGKKGARHIEKLKLAKGTE